MRNSRRKGSTEYVDELVEECQRRLQDEDKYLYVLVYGSLGSGKSFTSLGLANLVDPTFKDTYKDKIVYDALGYQYQVAEGNLNQGSVIVWDEASVSSSGMSGYKSQTNVNDIIRDQMKTQRLNNIGLILNCPNRMLEKDVKRELVFEFETIGVDKKKEVNKVRPIKNNFMRGFNKPSRKTIQVERKGGVTEPLVPLEIPKAPEHICKYYKNERKSYQRDMDKENLEKLVEEYQSKRGWKLEDFVARGYDREVVKKYIGEKGKSKDKGKDTKKARVKKVIRENPDKNLKEISKETGVKYGYVRWISSQMSE